MSVGLRILVPKLSPCNRTQSGSKALISSGEGCGEERKRCGKGGKLGAGKPAQCGSFSGSCPAGSFQQLIFFQDAFSLRSPTPDTPMASFQRWPLHHQQPGEGARAWWWSRFSWISFAVIFTNLNAQGAQGDWRELVLPLVSL